MMPPYKIILLSYDDLILKRLSKLISAVEYERRLKFSKDF